jgi:hypothetical protein
MIPTWLTTIKDVCKGFFLFGIVDTIEREKRCLDDFFMLGVFGGTIGFPGLFNYYHLRLFPYYAPHLKTWKRRVLREKDLFDHIRD